MLRNLGITDTCIAQGHQARFLGDEGQGGQCGWAFTYLAKLSAERSRLLATLRKSSKKEMAMKLSCTEALDRLNILGTV